MINQKHIFGEIPGIKEGKTFLDFDALRLAGIHKAKQSGIAGNSKEGASSIVLNGGYVDDSDKGDIIIYTGHGGNDGNSKKQIRDQDWLPPGNTGNIALRISEMKRKPVRVIRGHNHKSDYSPKSGYTYGGLYYVTKSYKEKGKDGYMICRYKLEKIYK